MFLTKEETEEVIRKRIEEIGKKYGDEVRLSVMEIITLSTGITEKSELIPVTKWNDKHPFPTVNAIRGYIQRGQLAAPIVVKCGKRTLLDEVLMLSWIRNKGADVI